MRLGVKEVAAQFRVTERTVLRWVDQDDLPVSKVDGHYRFSPAALLEWATARGMKIPPSLFIEPENGDREPTPSIAETLRTGGIVHGDLGADRESVIQALIQRLPLPKSVDREGLLHVILAREHMSSTGIGGGIAIPHVRNPIVLRVPRPVMILGLLERPIDFGSIDHQPVYAVFLTITPTTRSHLHILSRLSYVLQDPEMRGALARRAPDTQILSVIERIEARLAEPSAGA
jgi:PTS system nitrogen regulatory IIA component